MEREVGNLPESESPPLPSSTRASFNGDGRFGPRLLLVGKGSAVRACPAAMNSGASPSEAYIAVILSLMPMVGGRPSEASVRVDPNTGAEQAGMRFRSIRPRPWPKQP